MFGKKNVQSYCLPILSIHSDNQPNTRISNTGKFQARIISVQKEGADLSSKKPGRLESKALRGLLTDSPGSSGVSDVV